MLVKRELHFSNLANQPFCIFAVNPQPVTELVQAYLDALIRSAEWAATAGDELIDIWSRELYLDREFVEATFPPNVNEILMPRLDPDGLQILQHQIDFLYQYGFITSTFDVGDWVKADFMNRSA